METWRSEDRILQAKKMAPCMEIYDWQRHRQTQRSTAHFLLLVVIYGVTGKCIIFTELAIWEGVHSWNYSYSIIDMTWPAAREFCRESFTDLVSIQNSEENKHLNMVTPRHPSYYWIGIRKSRGVWTWVGTNKSLDKEAENWAEGEPTPGVEDCVEIYIKRLKDAGKWNNDPCEKQKRAICYLASCKPNSCSGHGECVETIGNYTCRCNEGFYGPECEFVEQCATLNAPDQATMDCTHPNGNFSFSSTCDFHCAAGFTLQGSQSLRCNATGIWTAEKPSCEAIKCGSLKIPGQGFMNCSHPFTDFSYNSTCDFSCDKGFELRGSDRFYCGASGRWIGQRANCDVVQCGSSQILRQGFMNCTHPTGEFNYNSTCNFSCTEGFELHGSDMLECGNWTAQSPTCQVYTFDKMWEPRKSIGATTGTLCALLFLSFVVWAIIRKHRKVKQEKTQLARNEDNMETTAV